MSRIVTLRATSLFLFVVAAGIAVRADEPVSPRPKLLIIGASSLNSPLPQTQLVAAMLESQQRGMDVEGRFPDLDNVADMLGTEQRWDYLIMDAWHLGRGPNQFGRADVPPEFPAAVEDFVKQARAHSPQCKIILFPWWVPHGPNATNEGVMEVFQSCVEQAKQNAIWVATTGPAFKAAELDRADLHITKSRTDAHPGKHGAYLNACSLFAIRTDKTPVGLPATLTVTSEPGKTKSFEIAPDEAKYLQELAWKIYQREKPQTRPGEKR